MNRNALNDLEIRPNEKLGFDVSCLTALFIDTAPGPQEHEKQSVDISFPGCTRMQYVTNRSYRMQKHKLSVTCHDMLFMETALGPTKHKK
jgi:hypothetical protein